MRSSVAVALIICGTVLILAPLIHNAIATGMVAWVMALTGKDVHLTADFPTYYYVACLIVGIAMVVIGIGRAFGSKPEV